MDNRNSITRPFGEPLPFDILEEFTEINEEDMQDALGWWDDNASKDWVGALDAPPFEG